MRKHILWLFLMFFCTAQGQLKEFTITEMPSPTQFPPIMRSHPDDGVLIIFSSIQNLNFDSNTSGVDEVKNDEDKYYVFLKPETQIITVKKRGYIEGKLPLMYLKAKEAKYFKIEEKYSGPAEISVNIITNPQDARIYIDGVFVGIKPQQKLKVGVHKLALEKEGYKRFEQPIEVSEGNTLFNLAMQQIDLVKVTLMSKPDGAAIFIDKQQKGVTDKSLFLIAGKYELKLSLSGCDDIITPLQVFEEKESIFTYTFVKNTGILNYTIIPLGASLFINKEKQERTTGVELVPGTYKIEIEKEGYKPFSETLDIAKGVTTDRSASMTPIYSSIQLTVTPPDALVDLIKNGETVSSWTGARLENGLRIGLYEVRASGAGYITEKRQISVTEGKITEIDITLQKSLSGSDQNNGLLEEPEVSAKKQRPELFAPKDEFESSSKYVARISEREVLVSRLKAEYDRKILLERQQRIEASERIVYDRPIDKLETYNPDEEQFEIIINGITGTISVPAAEARSLKENVQNTRVEAKVKLNYNLTKEILSEVVVIHPVSATRYKFNSQTSALVFVKGGYFNMGSNENENEKPIHKVWVDDFSIGKYEVTQEQWQDVMGNNPSEFKGDNLPVEIVSWNDIQEFLKKFNIKTGKKYRLPTEAEWEYAARGGGMNRDYKFSGFYHILKGVHDIVDKPSP
ncbi:MAG: PEGA domain-containing protein, partial [Ferruginibacter sp.]